MDHGPFEKSRTWLTIGLLFLLISSTLHVIDFTRKDEDIYKEIQADIQADFEAAVTYFSEDSSLRGEHRPYFKSSKLVYDAKGTLISWTNNELLPGEDKINKLKQLPEKRTLLLNNHAFLQIRRTEPDFTYVHLLPVYIRYEINNDFLIPYVFLGRWGEEQLLSDQERKNLRVSIGIAKAGIQIYDPEGVPVFAIDLTSFPIHVYRRHIRGWVLVCLALGIFFIGIFIWIFSSHRWQKKYIINGILLLSVLTVRMGLAVLGLPESYIQLEFFEPDVLSFHGLAPSLGEMTLNIITLLFVVWILYYYLHRVLNPFYRKLLQYPVLPWVLSAITVFAGSYLLKSYVDIFEQITLNSKVDIVFSNVFKTDINSFIILFDVGILLLAITLLIFMLIKFNIIYLNRLSIDPSGNRLPMVAYILYNVVIIVGINLLLHKTAPSLAFINSLTLVLLTIAIYRRPYRLISRHDLANHLLIIFTFSILVTYNVVIGIDVDNKIKVEQIADEILGNQSSNTIIGLEKSMLYMGTSTNEILDKRMESGNEEFVSWVKESYFTPNFPGFDIWLYLYDKNNKPLNRYKNRKPTFGPEADIAIKDRAEPINTMGTLFQFPSSDSRYLDLYVAEFNLTIDPTKQDSIHFVVELSPSKRETDGLYPSLSMDEKVYEETKLLNEYDHAIYQKGILKYYRGETQFPIYFADYEQFHSSYTQIGEEYTQYIKPIEHSKLVVVRYSTPTLFSIFSLFSFIFYFYTLATLLVLMLPIILWRSIQNRNFSLHFPLRTRIRAGLLAISILPMVVIIVFLMPFIRERFEEQAEKELIEEASRITEDLREEYLILNKTPFASIPHSKNKSFREKIQHLENIIKNDINVYDAQGFRIASTQTIIYENGLSSNLMNAEAFRRLKEGNTSDLVIEEEVGKLSYLSSYRPILGGKRDKPIGYVNVTYIAQQDQLKEQVLDFLAYLANIYLLIFFLLNILAVVLSNTITQPLSIIQHRLESISLGHLNQPILYESKDEIGQIVKAYNLMVEKLAASEKNLAQSQRELAWRQMARQVAHEIKNPLTPMKLTIQHLTRAWKEQSNGLERMFPRVMKTLLTQIDSMVRIANSFSEFAKMPDPVKTKTLLNDILLEVVDLYAQSEEAMWLIDIPPQKFWINADRDQLSRAIGNLIKNGLQAMEGEGVMHISMRIQSSQALIEIRDNGKGMTEEVKAKAFEPSFSTKSSGMGLGLVIVKRIIESINGRIYFHSILNEGTSFFIELPETEMSEQAAKASLEEQESINGNGHHA